MISSAAYLLVTLAGILPILLSEKRGHVKCKSYLAFFMIFLAVISLALKGYYYHHLKQNPVTDLHKIDEYRFFGIWANKVFKTFGVDSLQLLICVAYVYHYQSQLEHVAGREKLGVRQDYQTEVKLLHPLFGRKNDSLYVFTITLYLADSLALLTVVQLAIMLGVLFAIIMIELS